MPEQRRIPIFKAFLLIASVTLGSGCGGEFSYKRGANMTDFQSKKESCAEQNATESDIDTCLEKSGRVVVTFDKPLVKSQPKAGKNPDDSTAPIEQPEVTETVNPLDKVHISSWWKVGAGADQLLADGESCTSELGAAYQPEENMSLVTYGFIQCMKETGWFALQEK